MFDKLKKLISGSHELPTPDPVIKKRGRPRKEQVEAITNKTNISVPEKKKKSNPKIEELVTNEEFRIFKKDLSLQIRELRKSIKEFEESRDKQRLILKTTIDQFENTLNIHIRSAHVGDLEQIFSSIFKRLDDLEDKINKSNT